jgi:hypothetical protein
MPKIPSDERQPEDGEELVRLFIEALAREAARYEFRRQLEQAREAAASRNPSAVA